MATSSISYSYLSKKILDCEIPSEETFNILSLDHQIEILKSCYNKKRKLLVKLLDDKKNEQVYNKHKHQIGSNKWIVEECLKQKLIDRADNFRQRNKTPKFKVTGSNIQVTSSDDELEILNHDVNQNIEQDKENEHINIISSYNNTSSYYHESASSSDNDEATKNVTLHLFQNLENHVPSRIQRKDALFASNGNPIPKRVQKEDTLLSSNKNNAKKVQKANTRSKA
ncbi:46281_t:CDS:2, partial [Gigaspora margarita]